MHFYISTILYFCRVIDGRHEFDLIQGPPRQRRLRRNTEVNMFNNFTRLINSMLDPSGYDRKLRPDFGGKCNNTNKII